MPHAERRERLRALLREEGLDALLVVHPSNRYYLSGFELHDVQFNESAGCLVVARDGRDLLLTDARYRDAALRLWPGEDLRVYKGSARVAAIARALAEAGPRVGAETASMDAESASELARRLRPSALRGVNGLTERLRLVKDEAETRAMERSFALNHAMLRWVRGEIREGLTEAQLAWMIERYFRENGASELAFPSIVAFGANAALPHALPSDKRLERETCVLLDVGCRVDGYCSDQTRTFWFGDSPSPLFSRSLELVDRAQKAALALLRPGAPIAATARAALEVFERAGVAERFTHGLGHGVGLDTHEAPSFSWTAEGSFQAGTAVTVEPGLYYPGELGLRLEVTALVEEGGARVL